MLPVVDDVLRIHRDGQSPQFGCFPSGGDGFEVDLTIDRGGQRGKHVVLPVADHVLGNFGHPRLVEISLGSEVGWQLSFFFVKEEDPGDQPHGAHGNEVRSASHDAPDGGKLEAELWGFRFVHCEIRVR